LSKNDLNELSSFVHPPALVETIAKATLLLRDRHPVNNEVWKMFKANKEKLLEDLKTINADHVK